MDLERLVNSFDGFTVELMFVTFGLQIRLTSPRLLVIIPSKISPSSAKEAVLLNAPSYIQKKKPTKTADMDRPPISVDRSKRKNHSSTVKSKSFKSHFKLLISLSFILHAIP
jgi:hypothetical protein